MELAKSSLTKLSGDQMVNSAYDPLGHPDQMTIGNRTLINLTPGTNNYNNRFNNDNRLCFHRHLKNNSSEISKEIKGVGSEFQSTVRSPLVEDLVTPWIDFSLPPPTLPPPIVMSLQYPHQSRINAHFFPAHVTNYPSPTPEGDGALSDRSSMTSSKVCDDGVQGHWGHDSVSDSMRASTSSPEDEDGMRTPTYWIPSNGLPVSSSSSFSPLTNNKSHRGEDRDMDSGSSYKWDVYDILRDERRDIGEGGHVPLCPTASIRHSGSENDDPYDPEQPTTTDCATIEDKSTTTDSRPEGLSETELLCFLRLLEKKENHSSSIRYTLEQFITCIPVTTDVETQKQRTAAMSVARNEIYRRLLHVAPKATQRQVVHSMDLLPFILKSLAETAINGKRDLEDHANDRPSRRSRSRSNPHAPDDHRRRNRSRSQERRRIRIGSMLKRHRRVPSERLGFWSNFPENKGSFERGRNDVTMTPDRRTTDSRYNGRKRGKERRSSNGKTPVRLPHLEREEEEVEGGSKDPEEEKSSQWKRSSKSRRKSSSPGPGHVKERDKSDLRRDRKLHTFHPRNRLFRRKVQGRIGEGAKTPVQKISSLLNLDFTGAPGLLQHPSHRHNPLRRDPGTGLMTRGGLLPDPGTTAYKTAIEQSTTARLGNPSAFKQCRVGI